MRLKTLFALQILKRSRRFFSILVLSVFFLRSAALGVAYQRLYRKEPSNRFETEILKRIFIEAEVVSNVFPRISKVKQNGSIYSCYRNSFNIRSTRVFPLVFFHADDKYDSRVVLSVCCTILGVLRNHCRSSVRQKR